MSKPENPPAFPRDHRHLGHNGMDLRDYFAGQALTAWMSDGCPRGSDESIARECYGVADAMLAERAKGGA